MTTVINRTRERTETLPPLENGDHLDQETFHARYEADGIFRSRVFPGLWLDADAVLANQRKRVLAILEQGLATPEHASFVAKLEKQSGSK
jgi:hypothetical protein